MVEVRVLFTSPCAMKKLILIILLIALGLTGILSFVLPAPTQPHPEGIPEAEWALFSRLGSTPQWLEAERALLIPSYAASAPRTEAELPSDENILILSADGRALTLLSRIPQAGGYSVARMTMHTDTPGTFAYKDGEQMTELRFDFAPDSPQQLRRLISRTYSTAAPDNAAEIIITPGRSFSPAP